MLGRVERILSKGYFGSEPQVKGCALPSWAVQGKAFPLGFQCTPPFNQVIDNLYVYSE